MQTFVLVWDYGVFVWNALIVAVNFAFFPLLEHSVTFKHKNHQISVSYTVDWQANHMNFAHCFHAEEINRTLIQIGWNVIHGISEFTWRMGANTDWCKIYSFSETGHENVFKLVNYSKRPYSCWSLNPVLAFYPVSILFNFVQIMVDNSSYCTSLLTENCSLSLPLSF